MLYQPAAATPRHLPRFEALWSDVTRFLTAGADATEVPESGDTKLQRKHSVNQ